jgi:hypothetical protein
MDMGDEAAGLSAEAVSRLTRTGELRLVILPGNPLTNAQIDMLVPSWEKNKVFTSNAGSLPGGAGARDSAEGSEKAGVKTRFRKRRTWDDEEDAGVSSSIKGTPADVDDGFAPEAGTLPKGVYRKVRGSLDEVLSEVSDREGLTDSELERQVARLRSTTEGLPKEVSEHMRY